MVTFRSLKGPGEILYWLEVVVSFGRLLVPELVAEGVSFFLTLSRLNELFFILIIRYNDKIQ